jgi:hypothetical protein
VGVFYSATSSWNIGQQRQKGGYPHLGADDASAAFNFGPGENAISLVHVRPRSDVQAWAHKLRGMCAKKCNMISTSLSAAA